MNQGNNEAGLNLPPPVGEQPPAAEILPPAPAETGQAGVEQSPGRTQAPAVTATPLPLPVMPNEPVQATVPAVSSTTATDLPVASDESDLIEKEWVDKAKQIVERTRDDPYKQSEELTVVKADYMKKRYDKTIKVDK